MKRDMNLVRDIVITIGSSDSAVQAKDLYTSLQEKGYSREKIDYHVILLVEAKYLKGFVVTEVPSSNPIIQAMSYSTLTWEGQEFLSNAENDTIWKKVMAESEEKGTSVSMTILNSLLSAAAKKYFGLE